MKASDLIKLLEGYSAVFGNLDVRLEIQGDYFYRQIASIACTSDENGSPIFLLGDIGTKYSWKQGS